MLKRLFLSLILLLCYLPLLKAQSVLDSVLIIKAGTSAIPELAYYERSDFHTVRFEAPCNLSTIGNYAFRNCTNLRSIHFPSSLKKIGTGAFAFCENLSYAPLPKNLQDIGSLGFAYCLRLPEVVFPASLSHIGANAFSFCQSLSEVTLPKHLRELESYAFSECTSLIQATMPANSNLLGEMIFYGCSSIQKIIEPSVTPPPFDCNSQPFDLEETSLFNSCILVVPKNSMDKYRTAMGWKLFKNIITIH